MPTLFRESVARDLLDSPRSFHKRNYFVEKHDCCGNSRNSRSYLLLQNVVVSIVEGSGSKTISYFLFKMNAMVLILIIDGGIKQIY